MKSYSQNKEDIFIADYFGNFKGTLLDIGANDGFTLSNSRLLIEKGWKAHLVEPAQEPFMKLYDLYHSNIYVRTYMVAIGEKDCEAEILVSDSHLSKNDSGLLSTLVAKETERWKGKQKFTPQKVKVKTFNSLFSGMKFEFISIDAEGSDIEILKQIDLTDTRCLIIEWNGDRNNRRIIETYCYVYGLKTVKENAENLILVR